MRLTILSMCLFGGMLALAGIGLCLIICFSMIFENDQVLSFAFPFAVTWMMNLTLVGLGGLVALVLERGS